MVASLGPPPKDFVLQGRLGVRELYFDDDGEFLHLSMVTVLRCAGA